MVFLPDDAATARLGAALAQVLRPGDVVVLEGDLGAGKTALARAIIRNLMDDATMDVPSPSFALLQPYEGKGRTVLHADLYRLAAAGDVSELGLFENPEAIVIVEWAERSPEVEAEATVRVQLSAPKSGEGRHAEVTFGDERVI